MNVALFLSACLLVGFPLGLLVKSRTEKRLRGNAGGWMAFGTDSWPRLAASVAVNAVLGSLLVYFPFFLLLEAARRYRMDGDPETVFAVFLIGAAIGTGCRYLYWRRRDPWRSGWF